MRLPWGAGAGAPPSCPQPAVQLRGGDTAVPDVIGAHVVAASGQPPGRVCRGQSPSSGLLTAGNRRSKLSRRSFQLALLVPSSRSHFVDRLSPQRGLAFGKSSAITQTACSKRNIASSRTTTVRQILTGTQTIAHAQLFQLFLNFAFLRIRRYQNPHRGRRPRRCVEYIASRVIPLRASPGKRIFAHLIWFNQSRICRAFGRPTTANLRVCVSRYGHCASSSPASLLLRSESTSVSAHGRARSAKTVSDRHQMGSKKIVQPSRVRQTYEWVAQPRLTPRSTPASAALPSPYWTAE